MSLRADTIKGFSWSFIEQASNKVIQFIIGIILARLLSPSEFGLIGMITIFITLAESLASGGFVQALIRKNNCNSADYNTAFLFNIIVASTFYFVLLVIAPLIAGFYNQPSLTQIIRILCITIVIDSLSFVQRAKLLKKIDFKIFARISIISQTLSGIFGIVLAFKGFGVWSLVIKMISSRVFEGFQLWLFNKWLPTLTFNKESFKELFSFGSRLLISNTLERVSKNIYLLVIGKLFQASELGFYTRANQFKNLISEQTLTIVQRVTLPVLAKIQDDDTKLKIVFEKLLKMVSFLTFPIIIFLIIASKSMILSLIGEKWMKSVLYLQLIAGSAFFYPIGELNINILQVKGRSDLILKMQYIKKLFILPVIIIGFFFGMIPLLIAIVVLSVIEFVFSSYYSERFISYSVQAQFYEMFKTAVFPSIVGIIVFILGEYMKQAPLIILLAQSVIFFTVLVLIYEIFKNPLYMEIKDYIFKRS